MNHIQFYLAVNPNINNLESDFEDFCRNFYSKMAMGGYSHTLSMFYPTTKCSFNNEILDSPYNLLLKISSIGVHRFTYQNINSSCQVTDNGLLVNSISLVNPISFQGLLGLPVRVSETFIIKNISNKYYICNYILKTFN